jgi:hypothetical protein
MSLKIAVCISGEMRFFNNRLVIDGYNKFVQSLMPDVFISTWDHIGVSMNHGYIDPYENKQIDASLEDSIKSVYSNIKYLRIENYNTWIESIPIGVKESVYNGPYNPRTVNSYSQLYKIADSIDMKSKYENENGFTYDIVIRLRPDNLFIKNFDFNINFSTIYHINLPGDAYYPHRIYDILFYGDSTSMNKIGDTFKNYMYLLHDSFDNGLCKRDASRLMYLQALLSGLKVETTQNRLTDIYRGGTLEDYVTLLKSWGGV